MMQPMICSRRHMLRSSAFGLGSVAASLLLKKDGLLAESKSSNPVKPELEAQTYDLLPKAPPYPQQAKAMISMFMLGGPSQVDLFDPKPELIKRNGETFTGDLKFDNAAQASREIMGPAWKFSRHGQCGMELSELVPHLGSVADEITLIRSMHSAANNHLPANFALNTGQPVRGRPVLGSWLLKALGSETQDLPAYVALTDPRGLPLIAKENWNDGKLPSIFQGTMVRPNEPRIFNLDAPQHLRGGAQESQLAFLNRFNQAHLEEHPGESDLAARLASYGLAARMQLSAKEAFDLSKESDATKRMYGIDQKMTRSYGTRCLIARRLVERGVRFIQIFCNGQSWDHHGSILKALPDRCREIDQPAAALVRDLKQRGMLDDTLVVWGGEFGRTPMVEASAALGRSKGRDHHPQAFTMWFAGGGVKAGFSMGQTDELGFHVVDQPVHVHDVQATILHSLGLDHSRLSFRFRGLDFRLTGVEEHHPVRELLA